MALQHDLQTPQGLLIPNGYIVLVSIQWQKGQTHYGTALPWVSKEDRDAGREPFQVPIHVQFQYDVESSENILQQAYAALKAIPELADSIDV